MQVDELKEVKGLRELDGLTRGETLRVERRRRGENQHQAAQRLGVPRGRYSAWERDLEKGPWGKVEKLEPHEVCLTYRLRCGKSQQEVANDLEVCRMWVRLMEQGKAPCDRLLWYWEQ